MKNYLIKLYAQLVLAAICLALSACSNLPQARAYSD